MGEASRGAVLLVLFLPAPAEAWVPTPVRAVSVVGARGWSPHSLLGLGPARPPAVMRRV